MTFRNFFIKKNTIEEIKSLPKFTSHYYQYLTKTNEEKIEIEKRRRYQIYTLLDYVLSMVTYFDFFSNDTIKITKKSKLLAKACKNKVFTSEFLLFSFLDNDFEISKLLKNQNFNQKKIGTFISRVNKISSNSIKEKKDFLSFFSFKKEVITPKIKYSYDINKLFEKTAENALTRFKTPVITPEILLITMMENKTSNVGKIISSFLASETDWYMFRYKLIKKIHYQESLIRTDVKKNEQYFAYLLKINLSEFEFNRLLDTNLLNLGVSVFRSKIIRKLLSLNLFNLLEKDINKSIKATRTRRYST